MGVRLTWPLTGRSQEMRLIEAALTDPDVTGVVVSGAAGVGKSRIAYDALASAASRGCDSRWAVATSSARALPCWVRLHRGQAPLAPTHCSLSVA